MLEFLEQMDWIAWMDSRQQSKVRHALKDIVVIVLFATFADADDWLENRNVRQNSRGVFVQICESLFSIFPQWALQSP